MQGFCISSFGHFSITLCIQFNLAEQVALFWFTGNDGRFASLSPFEQSSKFSHQIITLLFCRLVATVTVRLKDRFNFFVIANFLLFFSGYERSKEGVTKGQKKEGSERRKHKDNFVLESA